MLEELSLLSLTLQPVAHNAYLFVFNYHIINDKFCLVICVCLTTVIRMQTETYLGLLIITTVFFESMTNQYFNKNLLNEGRWWHE